jgi:hypothetical protein
VQIKSDQPSCQRRQEKHAQKVPLYTSEIQAPQLPGGHREMSFATVSGALPLIAEKLPYQKGRVIQCHF